MTAAVLAFLSAVRKAVQAGGITITDELQAEAGPTITDEAGSPLLTEIAPPTPYVTTGYVAVTYVGTS